MRGGCLCGKVRFVLLSDPFDAGWCHCRTCQRSSGSPAMAFATVAAADYRIESGASPVGTIASTDYGRRRFCRGCGTPLTIEVAITPPESDEARAKARRKAEAASASASAAWLAQILEHHKGIEAQFATVKAAADPASRRAEQEKLGLLLTGHSLAEEAAVYPALAADHQVGHAELAYQEQSAAKMEMGLLERLDPMSEDYLDKLEHIRGAVAHHVYSEEYARYMNSLA